MQKLHRATAHGGALQWALFTALLAGCSTLVPAPAAPPSTPQAVLVAAWARVLNRFVNVRGEVDFPALARDRADLDTDVRHVAHSPLKRWPDEPLRLAHMINAYNALPMFNVTESGIPATHAGPNKLRFFLLGKLDWLSELLDSYPTDFVPSAADSQLARANRSAPQPAPATSRHASASR